MVLTIIIFIALIILYVVSAVRYTNKRKTTRHTESVEREKKISSKAEVKPLSEEPKTARLPKKNRWNFSERNLHKALLKGRRQGHLRIAYHGSWYNTGLHLINTAK